MSLITSRKTPLKIILKKTMFATKVKKEPNLICTAQRLKRNGKLRIQEPSSQKQSRKFETVIICIEIL